MVFVNHFSHIRVVMWAAVMYMKGKNPVTLYIFWKFGIPFYRKTNFHGWI